MIIIIHKRSTPRLLSKAGAGTVADAGLGCPLDADSLCATFKSAGRSLTTLTQAVDKGRGERREPCCLRRCGRKRCGVSRSGKFLFGGTIPVISRFPIAVARRIAIVRYCDSTVQTVPCSQ